MCRTIRLHPICGSVWLTIENRIVKYFFIAFFLSVQLLCYGQNNDNFKKLQEISLDRIYQEKQKPKSKSNAKPQLEQNIEQSLLRQKMRHAVSR